MMEIEITSPDECDRVVSALHRLRKHWIPRGAQHCPFFTFGAASYLDDAAEYRRIVPVYNRLLKQHFGALIETLLSTLARELEAPVALDERLAMPGFHIWQGPGIFTTPTASTHFDIQYERLEWPNSPPPDFDRSISFTLPLRLPRRGGGLNLWNLTLPQYVAICQKAGEWVDIEALARSEVPRYHSYSPGRLVLHSGHILHRIAPVADVDPDDQRITLQGHGLKSGGKWVFYW